MTDTISGCLSSRDKPSPRILAFTLISHAANEKQNVGNKSIYVDVDASANVHVHVHVHVNVHVHVHVHVRVNCECEL